MKTAKQRKKEIERVDKAVYALLLVCRGEPSLITHARHELRNALHFAQDARRGEKQEVVKPDLQLKTCPECNGASAGCSECEGRGVVGC